jgi:predicted phosphohydrolase
MRIIVTADLHYDIARSRAPAIETADRICQLEADALLVLGDAAGADIAILSEALHLFDRFPGRKFFVAGNHDIWTRPGEDSLRRLETELPECCRDANFHLLDDQPALLDGVALAGTMGWYDYSFRPAHLKIPLRFYEAKIAPGAAARVADYAHLLTDRSDVPTSAMQLGARWMDGVHVRLPMDDVSFCRRLCDRLGEHLTWASRQTDRIVVGLHHLPFQALVPRQEKPNWAFAGAYLGSEMFGRELLRYPKVRHAFCGHSHYPGSVCCRHVECTNVGSTYQTKRYQIVDV